MKLYSDKGLKELGRLLKSIPVSDWKQIAKFHKIVINYLKMDKILKTKK